MADAYLLLKRMHLFVNMSEDELRRLAPQFKEVLVDEGQLVFQQNSPADAFYIIQSGQVEVSTVGALSGKVRRLGVLVEADFFGEMGLLRGGYRNASIRAATPVKLWKLDRADFNTFLARNPRIKPHLEVALMSRQYARDLNFNWLRENENIYLLTLRHRLFLLEMLWLPSVAMLAILLAAGGMLYFKLPPTWLIAPGIALLVDLGWLRWNWVDFHNDWYIVTNQRVVDIDKIALIYDSRAEAPLSTVNNTSITTTEWGRQWGYGDVVFNTFSGPITFHDIPNPQASVDLVMEQLNRTRVQARLAERETLKTSLQQSIGLVPPPQPAPRPPQKKQRKSPLSQLRFSIRVREEKDGAVIYHKHPYVLFLSVGGQLAGIVVTLALVVLRLAGAIAMLNPWVFAGLAILVLLILAGSVIYEYVDWTNDQYIVTANQIIDVDRKPLGTEQRRTANLEAVMNVTYVRPNFIATLLNFGTVTVATGPGGEMKFFNVFNPLDVQQDIYRRKEALSAQKAADAARQRREEYTQYFGAFYEIMEEERKKREGK